MMFLRTSFLVAIFLLVKSVHSQNTYPRMSAYAGVMHPLVTYTVNDKPHYNFDHVYTVGVPIGLNYWKTNNVGLSFEFVPIIRAEKGTSRMNNFLFHPGIVTPLGHGFTFAGRAAFETSGRYGFTPVLNKVVKKNKSSNIYIAVPLPVRFGNNLPTTFTVAFQFGISF